MSKLLRVLCLVIALLAIGRSTRGQCTPPPPETIVLTWQPLAKVQIRPDPNSTAAATTAMNDWNNATLFYCFSPTFTFDSGTGEYMTVNYVFIPNDPNGTTRRAKTTITTSGRITSAVVLLNNIVPLTFPLSLADALNHEIGHTMGLNDCNYPGCPLNSSVMENEVPTDVVPLWGFTGPNPPGGPTACDLAVMTEVAPDYLCPPPPPPLDCPPCDPDTGCPICFRNCGGCPSPIILDISGKGFSLTNAANGVMFDISGTGNPIQIGWTAMGSDNAFLALPGADGLVHDGKQLFGNFTSQPPSDSPNGFAALAVYDDPKNGGNGDGIIDSRDAIFSSLRLWIDASHDGISQPGELHTLASMGVNSISLNYHADAKHDQYGNGFRYRARVNPDEVTDVGKGAYDVFFVRLPPPISKNSTTPFARPASAQCPVPVRTKRGLLSTAGTIP